MACKAMISRSDSSNPPTLPTRLYWLTPLGFEACAWIEQQEQQPPAPENDEYAFTCVFCEKPLVKCKCGTGQE